MFNLNHQYIKYYFLAAPKMSSAIQVQQSTWKAPNVKLAKRTWFDFSSLDISVLAPCFNVYLFI